MASLGQIFIRRLGDAGSLVRLGGDEFLILFCGDDLERVIAQTVADLHNESFASEIAHERNITLSAGFSSSAPNEIADPDLLYFLADKALYSMKKDRPSPSRGGSENDKDLLQHTGSWTV